MANITGSGEDDVLTGTAANDSINGGDGDDVIDGLGGNDRLDGGIGNDTLTGGTGSDRLIGGDGRDIYFINDANDIDKSARDGGLDTVRSTVSYTLGSEQEYLTLLGRSNLNGTGNDLNNLLTGNSGDNRLGGGVGSDTLIGGSGDDTVDGGRGYDQLIGGPGNDIYVIDNINEINHDVQDRGSDLVMSTVSYVLDRENEQEHVTLIGDANLTATGRIDANRLTGNSGDNILSGLDGNDQLVGGPGDDRLLGGDGRDILIFDVRDTRGVDGGDDTDILKVTGTAPADLRALNGGVRRFTSLEEIDLGAPGEQSVLLNKKAVLELSSGGGTVRVNGTTDDAVLTDDLWIRFGDRVDGDNGVSYMQFRSGDAVLLVQRGINTGGIKHVTATVELSSLDGVNGVTLNGIDRSDRCGASVAGANDVNGDGLADVIIGAFLADPAGTVYAGESYVVFGNEDGFGSSFELDSLNGTNGFRIDGVDASDFSGRTVASAGDFNGDGFADLIIGARGAESDGNSDAGETYVVFGRNSGFGSNLDLDLLNGTNGFRLDGIDACDFSGHSVASAGDLNGDGLDDLLIGAPGADGYTGETYVVFGRVDGFESVFQLESLSGTNGFLLIGGDSNDQSGTSVAGVDDINGDGYADLIIGAPFADRAGSRNAGETYVVFGKSGGFDSSLDLGELDGSNGFRLVGFDRDELSGLSVSAAGDVNGDGLADMLIGAPQASGLEDVAGAAYIVFGSSDGFASTIDLGILNGTNGFRLDGNAASDGTGNSVAAAGDVNADGIDDLIIGAPFADLGAHFSLGKAFVVFGNRNWASPVFDLGALNGRNGFQLQGDEAKDFSGKSVAGAGDVNGDGFDDMIIGDDSAFTSSAGKSYVIFGTDFRSEVDFQGTDADNTLSGTASGDLMVGGLGNDTLRGGGGKDVLTGGSGNDSLNGGGSLDLLRGGTGNDQLNGAAGNDRLEGDEGRDTLDGGAGNDVLLGGAGNDIFRFNDALEASNVDRLMDFGGAGNAAFDVIQLDDAIFTTLTVGTLNETAFESGTDTDADAAGTRIIYHTETGELYYDADGSATGSAPVLFALLASDPDGLVAGDFVVI